MTNSSLLNDYIAGQTNPEAGASPEEQLRCALVRVERINYTAGLHEAVSRMEMIAAVVPSSVTKAQLIDMLEKEIAACILRWKVIVATQ